jgi:hypothetical protein
VNGELVAVAWRYRRHAEPKTVGDGSWAASRVHLSFEAWVDGGTAPRRLVWTLCGISVYGSALAVGEHAYEVSEERCERCWNRPGVRS